MKNFIYKDKEIEFNYWGNSHGIIILNGGTTTIYINLQSFSAEEDILEKFFDDFVTGRALRTLKNKIKIEFQKDIPQ